MDEFRADLDTLLGDLDAALRELTSPFEQDPAGWAGAVPGHWSAGQQVEHVGKILAVGADALEAGARRQRDGTLPRRPWRDPLQRWFVSLVMRDPFPRGGRAPRTARPGPAPERAAALSLVRRGMDRHRALVASLEAEEARRLWIRNPWAPAWLRWHYTLPEILRVQATHARHHARLAREASRNRQPA